MSDMSTEGNLSSAPLGVGTQHVLGQPDWKKRRPTYNPYTTLPLPTDHYIQLRFQLFLFPRVYRIAEIPMSYTCANLHKLIMYMFGWSNAHLHKSEVFSNVVMHESNDIDKVGMMKTYGRKAPQPPVWATNARELRDWNHFARSDEPLYLVEEEVTNRKDPWTSATMMEDWELTVADIWNEDRTKNASKGVYDNTAIGILYTYDFGDDWNVHITCSSDPFRKLEIPSNELRVVAASGAPPIEDVHGDVPGEINGDDKTVSPLIFERSTFTKYCNGEIGSEASKVELAIFRHGERGNDADGEDEEDFDAEDD